MRRSSLPSISITIRDGYLLVNRNSALTDEGGEVRRPDADVPADVDGWQLTAAPQLAGRLQRNAELTCDLAHVEETDRLWGRGSWRLGQAGPRPALKLPGEGEQLGRLGTSHEKLDSLAVDHGRRSGQPTRPSA